MSQIAPYIEYPIEEIDQCNFENTFSSLNFVQGSQEACECTVELSA